ncbi:MAG: RDD family protein [Brevinema sp.]
MSKKQKKLKVLKPAPWWKRILAYMVDSVFLFIVLVLFISGIYGQDFVKLLDNISQYGALELLKQEPSFPANMLAQIDNMNPNEQNTAYWLYIIRNRYSQSIFILNQIISICYFALFWWNTGQTIGGRLLKIRVISPFYDKIPILSVITRVTTLKLVEITWGLPLLIIINPVLKQRIHDSLSNTVVVEDPQQEEEEHIPPRPEEDQKLSDLMSDKNNDQQ